MARWSTVLRRAWTRVSTAVRADHARLCPVVDFDPEVGSLEVRLQAVTGGEPFNIKREALVSGHGWRGDRRFKIPVPEIAHFNILVKEKFEWTGDRLICSDSSVPEILARLRGEIPISETTRARAVRSENSKVVVQVREGPDDSVEILLTGTSDEGGVFPLVPDDVRNGAVRRLGSTFYSIPRWPEQVSHEFSGSRFVHDGKLERALALADEIDELRQVSSVHVSEGVERLIASARQPLETELVPAVDFSESERTLQVSLSERDAQGKQVPLSTRALAPHLVDGKFASLRAESLDLLNRLQRVKGEAVGPILRFQGGAVPEALEILRAERRTEQSPSAAAVQIHNQPLEQRTYLELEDPDTLVVHQNLVTQDERQIEPPAVTGSEWPSWIRVRNEYFKAPRGKPLRLRDGVSSEASLRLHGDAVPDFVTEQLPEVKKNSRVFIDARAGELKVVTAPLQPHALVDLDKTTNRVVVRPKYRSGSADIEHSKLRRWDRKRRYFRDGSTFHRLDWNSVREVQGAIDSSGLDEEPDGSYTSPALHMQEIINTFSRLGILSETEVFKRFRERLLGFKNIEAAALPSSLRPDVHLRDYQRAGYDWLVFLKDHGLPGVLADKMGLGKTLEALLVIAQFKERFGRCPSLVVCPAALVQKWFDETAKFFNGLRPVTHAGTRRRDSLRENIATADLVITSYETLVRDADVLAQWKWRFLVLDEAQRIKNPETKRSKAAREIGAEARIAITGTPVENRLLDLWSIFDFLAQGYLGTQASFQRSYEDPIERHSDKEAAEQLNRKTRPFIMRRLKKQVAKELPEKILKALRCELTPLQRRLYQAVLDHDLAAAIEAVGGKKLSLGNPHIFAVLTKLKQICCHPGLVMNDFRPFQTGISGKFDTFCEILDEVLESAPDGRPAKMVGFSQYVGMADYLGSYITSRKKKCELIDGHVPPRDRPSLCDAFNKDPTSFGMILTLGSGGVGLDLQSANYVFLYDRWWNPAGEDQAIDRVHRLGQDREVVVVTITTRGTLEERIEAKLDRKRSLAGQVVHADELMRKEISREELLELVRLD